jgi:hypothetical protein
MGEKPNAYSLLTGNCEGRIPLGSRRRIWEDNVKNSEEIFWGVDWIHLAEYRER